MIIHKYSPIFILCGVYKIMIKQILKKYKGMKYKIYKDILGGELSDYKIAKKYNITRQYVHRLRKQLYLELRERYFDIKK